MKGDVAKVVVEQAVVPTWQSRDRGHCPTNRFLEVVIWLYRNVVL